MRKLISRLSLSSEFKECEKNLKTLQQIKAIIGDPSDLKRTDIHGIESLQDSMLEYLAEARCNLHLEKNFFWLLVLFKQFLSSPELLLASGVHLYYSTPSDINYFGFLESYGAQLHPLPSDSEGIVVDSFNEKRKSKNDSVLFIWSSCTPQRMFLLSKSRRDKILNVCKTHNIPIIDNCMLEAYNLERDAPQFFIS